MSNGKTLDHLQQLSKMAMQSSKQLNQQMSILENVMSETLKNAPEENKAEIEKVKALTNKAINLAKQGKMQDVDQIIKNFKNGR